MRFGRPTDREKQRADDAAKKENQEAGVPTIMLHERTDADAGERGARIAEQSGEPDGRSGGPLGRELCCGGADEALRPVDEEASRAEQAEIGRASCRETVA